MTSNPPGKHRVSVSLRNAGLLAALDQRCDIEGLAQSTMIRKAVMAYLNVDANGTALPAKQAIIPLTATAQRVLNAAVNWWTANRSREMSDDSELYAYYLEDPTRILVTAAADLATGRPE